MNKGFVDTRLANAHSFQCDSLAGLEVEHVVGLYDGRDPNAIEILVIKLKGKELWQVFFLDAGLGFWEEVNSIIDWENARSVDLAKTYSLTNQAIKSISCTGSNKVFSSIIFEIGNTKFQLKYEDALDIDSQTLLIKI